MFGQMGPKKKNLTPIGKGGITKHAGKGSSAQVLPNRSSISTLTAGNVGDRTMNNYAKSTPMAQPQADVAGTAMPSFGGPDGG